MSKTTAETTAKTTRRRGRPATRLDRVRAALLGHRRPDLGHPDVVAVTDCGLARELKTTTQNAHKAVTALVEARLVVALAPEERVGPTLRRKRGRTLRRAGVYAVAPDLCPSSKFSTATSGGGETVPLTVLLPAVAVGNLDDGQNSFASWRFGVWQGFQLAVRDTLRRACRARGEPFELLGGRWLTARRRALYRRSLLRKMALRFADGLTPDDLVERAAMSWPRGKKMRRSGRLPLLYAWGVGAEVELAVERWPAEEATRAAAEKRELEAKLAEAKARGESRGEKMRRLRERLDAVLDNKVWRPLYDEFCNLGHSDEAVRAFEDKLRRIESGVWATASSSG